MIDPGIELAWCIYERQATGPHKKTGRSNGAAGGSDVNRSGGLEGAGHFAVTRATVEQCVDTACSLLTTVLAVLTIVALVGQLELNVVVVEQDRSVPLAIHRRPDRTRDVSAWERDLAV